jgi:hypothetical protein
VANKSLQKKTDMIAAARMAIASALRASYWQESSQPLPNRIARLLREQELRDQAAERDDQ